MPAGVRKMPTAIDSPATAAVADARPICRCNLLSPAAAKSAGALAVVVTAVAAMLFNYLGYQSVIVDLFVMASLVITLVSAFDYLLHARQIIDGSAR